MSDKLNSAIAVIGIDIGKNSFHVVGHDKRGAIMLRQKWSRGQVEARLANLPPCLIGGHLRYVHHLRRKWQQIWLLRPIMAQTVRLWISVVRSERSLDRGDGEPASLKVAVLSPPSADYPTVTYTLDGQ